MVLVAVPKLGLLIKFSMNFGYKINGPYYQDALRVPELLPLICSIAGGVFVFQHIELVTQ